MCQTVVTPDGQWLTSIEAIEAVVAGVDFTDEDREGREPNECLCGVDVCAALDRAGIKYVDDCGFIDIEAKP